MGLLGGGDKRRALAELNCDLQKEHALKNIAWAELQRTRGELKRLQEEAEMNRVSRLYAEKELHSAREEIFKLSRRILIVEEVTQSTKARISPARRRL